MPFRSNLATPDVAQLLQNAASEPGYGRRVGVAAWVVVGLLAGWIAGRISGQPQHGFLRKVAVGVLGALVGGALARAAGHEGITEFGLRSVVVAALGATLLLLVLGALEGRRWN